VLEKLFNFIIKASNLQPDYYAERCLAVTRQVGGCDLCEKACPHDAITIKRQVEINDVDCTGCGLCVQVCPSQALETNVTYQAGAPLKCSQVKGSAQSVQCLTRLEATDLVRLASARKTLTLVRNDCADCPVGCADVPEALEKTVQQAHVLAKQLGRDFETNVIETEHYDSTDNPDPISRRELLRGGFKGVQRTAADVIAPLDLLPQDEPEKPLPKEHSKKLQIIKMSKPAPEQVVPWVLPRIAEGCIVCPICTKVCPTGAFSRIFEPADEGAGKGLWLEPERCNGCDACVKSCPVKVITLDEQVTWGELSAGKVEVYHKEGRDAPEGTVARSGRGRPAAILSSSTSETVSSKTSQAEPDGESEGNAVDSVDADSVNASSVDASSVDGVKDTNQKND
jgi:ferredoxin